MGTGPAKLWVALAQGEVVVKICGRATFACGADLKRLLGELRGRGWQRFTFDLTGCPLMDSTFLGILAGFGMKVSEAKGRKATLLNPSSKIVDLLDNLGVGHLFETQQGTTALADQCQPVELSGPPASKAETTRTALEAHETLMAIEPSNAPKFKDVIRFLAEDLNKLEPPSP